MKRKIRNFFAQLRLENAKLAEHNKNKPETPLHNKIEKAVGLFTVLLWVVIIVLSCPFNSSAAEETNVIKAGTYLFIDDIPTGPSNSNVAIEFDLPFTYSFDAFDVDYTVECSSIQYYLTYLYFYAESSTPPLSELGYDVPGYIHAAVNNNWYTGSKEITVLRDTVVSDSVEYSWFTDNTIPLDVDTDFVIPLGHYTFISQPVLPSLLSGLAPLDYYGTIVYNGHIYNELSLTTDTILLNDSDNNTIMLYGLTTENGGWHSSKEFYLVSDLVCEDETAYNFLMDNIAETEGNSFDVVTFFFVSLFKSLDNFIIFYDFSLLDLIFSLVGMLGAIWFLKVLAGG